MAMLPKAFSETIRNLCLLHHDGIPRIIWPLGNFPGEFQYLRQGKHDPPLSISSNMSSTLTNIISKGFLVAYLKPDAPCYPIFNGWCYLIAVTDGAAVSLALLQIYHLWKIFSQNRDLLHYLKSMHKLRVEERKIRKDERRIRKEMKRRNEEMFRARIQSQSYRYPAEPMRPDAAYIRRSYDTLMDDVESQTTKSSRSGSQRHAVNHGWGPKTGKPAAPVYMHGALQTDNRGIPIQQGRGEHWPQTRVYSNNRQELPNPAFAQTTVGNPYDRPLPNPPGQRPRTNGHTERMDGQGRRETRYVSGHLTPDPSPGTHQRDNRSNRAPSVAPSTRTTATHASSRQRYRAPSVADMDYDEDWAYVTAREPPSPCSPRRPSGEVPFITISRPGSDRDAVNFRRSNNASRAGTDGVSVYTKVHGGRVIEEVITPVPSPSPMEMGVGVAEFRARGPDQFKFTRRLFSRFIDALRGRN